MAQNTFWQHFFFFWCDELRILTQKGGGPRSEIRHTEGGGVRGPCDICHTFFFEAFPNPLQWLLLCFVYAAYSSIPKSKALIPKVKGEFGLWAVSKILCQVWFFLSLSQANMPYVIDLQGWCEQVQRRMISTN